MQTLLSGRNIRRLITISILVVLIIVFGVTTDSFYSLRNVQQLFREAAYVGLISLGVSFVIIAGCIDLSSGGIVCIAGIICARLASVGCPGIVCVLGAVLVGAACGLFNAFCITRLHLSDFITTLASGYVFSGFGVMTMFRDSHGRYHSPTLTNQDFIILGKSINGWYRITIAWLILAVIIFFIHSRTRFGQHIIATGSNASSARMSGVNVDRVKTSCFVLAGAFCGVAAAFIVAYQSTAYLSLGGSIGFQAVVCCVIGGIVLGGGKGDALSSVLGALIITMILNGLNKYGLSASWQYIAQGTMMVIIIIFDAVFGQIGEKRLDRIAQNDTSHALEEQSPVSGGEHNG